MKNNLFKISIIVILTAVVVLVGFKLNDNNQSAYVDTTQLFMEFSMKKELSARYDAEETKNLARLDTLQYHLEAFNQQLYQKGNASTEELKQLDMMTRQYYAEKQAADERLKEIAAEYDSQIWKQLNQYIEDYGKAHNYEFIFGANGQGNLMYANSGNNVTEDIVDYVNKKYNGSI